MFRLQGSLSIQPPGYKLETNGRMVWEAVENRFFVDGEWNKSCTTSTHAAPLLRYQATHNSPLDPTIVILVGCLTSKCGDSRVVQDFFHLRHQLWKYFLNQCYNAGAWGWRRLLLIPSNTFSHNWCRISSTHRTVKRAARW